MPNSSLRFGEIRGFLEAFARFNDKPDHGYSFTFELLPSTNSIRASMELHFNGALTSLELTPIADWRTAIRDILSRSLFGQLLTDNRDSVRVFNWLIDRIDSCANPSTTWKADVGVSGFYECDWDDVVFQTGDTAYLLHLGVSD
jgi:hypothetical protein